MILRKIFKVLNHLGARSILPIVVLIILNGFFEVIGISALIPIITLLISNVDSPAMEIAFWLFIRLKVFSPCLSITNKDNIFMILRKS